jgi:hypothetical protein
MHRAPTLLTLIGIVVAATGCSRSGPPGADVGAEIASLEQAVAAARTKLERLRDYDDLENLAGLYGHYVDKSRHDDVADLFAKDGVVEIYGRGVFVGQDRVRQYQHNLSPGAVGPRDGVLFNHFHLQPVIHVAPDGKTAAARSHAVIMYGIYGTDAQWGGAIYENQFVKEDGVWKIKYLHTYQTFYTHYEDGWTTKPLPMMGVYSRLPPDRPQSISYEPYPAAFVPPFDFVNPVSGRADHYADPGLRE